MQRDIDCGGSSTDGLPWHVRHTPPMCLTRRLCRWRPRRAPSAVQVTLWHAPRRHQQLRLPRARNPWVARYLGSARWALLLLLRLRLSCTSGGAGNTRKWVLGTGLDLDRDLHARGARRRQVTIPRRAATAWLPAAGAPGIRHRPPIALAGICMGASVRAPCQKPKKRVP